MDAILNTISGMDASDWAAWYAATVATAALVWEIVKHSRAGLRLFVTGQGDMMLAGAGHPGRGKAHIVITVRHLSGPPTTVTHVGFWQFDSRWHKLWSYDAPQWLRRLFKTRPFDGGFLLTDDLCRYPHKLEVGTEWTCTIEQSKLDDLRATGDLYLVIGHTLGSRNILRKVVFPRSQSGPDRPVSKDNARA